MIQAKNYEKNCEIVSRSSVLVTRAKLTDDSKALFPLTQEARMSGAQSENGIMNIGISIS